MNREILQAIMAAIIFAGRRPCRNEYPGLEDDIRESVNNADSIIQKIEVRSPLGKIASF